MVTYCLQGAGVVASLPTSKRSTPRTALRTQRIISCLSQTRNSTHSIRRGLRPNRSLSRSWSAALGGNVTDYRPLGYPACLVNQTGNRGPGSDYRRCSGRRYFRRSCRRAPHRCAASRHINRSEYRADRALGSSGSAPTARRDYYHIAATPQLCRSVPSAPRCAHRRARDRAG
jgi:hypothetical protein